MLLFALVSFIASFHANSALVDSGLKVGELTFSITQGIQILLVQKCIAHKTLCI